LRYKDAADLVGSAEADGAGEAVAVESADVFGQGWKDLVSLHLAYDHTVVQVRAGNKDGGYESPLTYSLNGTHPVAVKAGDFNADGRVDLAVLDEEKATISFLYQNDLGGFDAGRVVNVGGRPVAMAVDDLDRDGITDMVVARADDNTLRVMLGMGDFSKVTAEIIRVAGVGALTDVKSGHIGLYDHFKDLVVSGTGGVAVLNGLGDGTFRRARIIGTEGVGHLAIGDLKSEGFSSIVGTEMGAGSDVIIWPARGGKGLGAAQHYFAGHGMTSVAIGNFKGTNALADIAVGTVDGVNLLLNNSNGFRNAPISLGMSDTAAGLAVGARKYGIQKIAVAHRHGLVAPEVTTGGRIDVTITTDENDCTTCTVAQLEAIVGIGPNFAFGGGLGISLREAITAVNNDSVVNGSSGWTIGFAGINTTTVVGSATAGGGHNPSAVTFASPGPANSFWSLTTSAALVASFGVTGLPPLIAPATTIDGSLVDTSVNGVNNAIGPRVQINGVATDTHVQIERLFFITSSAPNTQIMNLSIVGSLSDGITVAAPSCTIQNNFIGLFADGTAHMSQVNIGSGVDFQSGSINETVTNNFISNNGVGATGVAPSPAAGGILINGVSQSTAVPQNNTISNNKIGLDIFGDSGHDGPGHQTGNNGDGILLQNGAVGNTITGNTISGNYFDGIEEIGNISADAIIQNNKIGTDANGVGTKGNDGFTLNNGMNGIHLGTTGNPKFNQVSGNTVSGNTLFGIVLSSGDSTPQFTTVTNNKVGTNVVGSVQLPNISGGVDLTGRASNDTIGGTHAADGNIISGNGVGAAGPGITFDMLANNALVQNNLIGPNNLSAGPPVDLNAPPPQTSNKGGGVLLQGGAFANKLIANLIAFNNDGTSVSGITDISTGNFNLFSQNLIFLNPQNTTPTDAQIIDAAGQQGMRNGQVDTTLTSLIRVTGATTITCNGQTTVTGTANFQFHGVIANINGATVEIFASQRGSTSVQSASEAQAFIGSIPASTFTVDPNDATGNTFDWSFSGTVPAPFFNPVQTPTLFITATITTGDLSTSPLSMGFVSAFLTPQGCSPGGPTCQITANPTTVTFNNATVGQTASQNVVLTNSGTGSITVNTVSLTQTGTLFTLGALTLPVTLTQSQTLTVAVKFTPTNASPATATLSVTDTCQNLAIPISGNPTSVKIGETPNPVIFPNANLGQNSTAIMTVINFGTGTLSVTALTLGGGASSPFSVVSPAVPFSINGSSTQAVSLKFTPTAAGAATDTLTIVSSDPVTPSLGVTLNGTGVATTPPIVIVNQPQSGSVVGSGSQFTVGFGASPAQGATLVSYTASLSIDGGATFSSIGSGPATSLVTFQALAPNVTTTNAVVKVAVTDSNNLVGTAQSGFFTIGTPPAIIPGSVTRTKKLFFSATGVLPGAVLVVQGTGETFALSGTGPDFVIGKAETGSGGNRIRDLSNPFTFVVRNPNGLISNAAVALR
jgi:hypothetical protein